MIYLILLLGLVLRLVNIDQSFWLDEASQALTSQKSLEYILFQNLADFHPPLSYLLTHIWIQLGTSEIWLRLLQILFGVGTIFFVYKICEELFNKKVGLISALLLSLAPYHIYYSQEFRMYTIATFFATVSMYYFVKLLSSKFSWKISSFYVLFSTLLIYTHYMGFFLLFTQFLTVLILTRERLKQFIFFLFGVGLLFLPWVLFFIRQLNSGVAADSYLPGWSQMLSLELYKAIPLMVIKFTIGRLDFSNNYLYAVVALLVFSLVGLLFFKGFWENKNFQKNQNYLVILFWFLLPIVLTFLISFKVPMFQPFRLLFILPAFVILLAIGIMQFGKYTKFTLGIVILTFLISHIYFLLNPIYWREDWKGAMNYLRQNKDARIIAAWPEPFAPMIWYGKDLKLQGVVTKIPATQDDTESIKDEKIFYVSYLSQLSDPKGLVKRYLDQNYTLVETKDFRGVGFIYAYQKK